MSVEKHLSNARKFHNQNRLSDAIYEYRRVLALDPTNKEAREALNSLIDEPIDTEASAAPEEDNGRIKTNFLAHQATETSVPITKQPLIMFLAAIIGIGAIYGLYQLVTYYVNYDKIVAMKYVEVHLQKPVQKDGMAYVSVEIDNFNPQDIKDTNFRYEISGATGNKLASGNVTIPNTVPAGDQRTFSNVPLTKLNEQATRMHADLVDLNLGPKPYMSNELVNKFIEASALKPEDAVPALTDFVKAEPEFGPGYIRLGQAMLANKDYEHAIKAFEKAIKLNSEDANAHYHLGVAYFYKPDAEAARKEFETAAKLAPDDPVIAAALKQATPGSASSGGGKNTDKSASRDEEESGGAK